VESPAEEVVVSLRLLLARVLLVLAGGLGGGLAVVGGVTLHGAGVLAIAVAGGLAGCLAAGITRDAPAGRRATSDAAGRAAVGTVLGLLVVAGSAAVAGRAAPVPVVLLAALLGPAWWARRSARPVLPPPDAATPPRGAVPPATHPPARRGLHPAGRGTVQSGGPPSAVVPPAPALPPAAAMPVPELSREWRRTAAALESAVDPAERARVVRRRGEVLDELERRDPAGFARWLAAGASADTFPVRPLRGDSASGPGGPAPLA
jgi:hypothetical protein